MKHWKCTTIVLILRKQSQSIVACIEIWTVHFRSVSAILKSNLMQKIFMMIDKIHTQHRTHIECSLYLFLRGNKNWYSTRYNLTTQHDLTALHFKSKKITFYDQCWTDIIMVAAHFFLPVGFLMAVAGCFCFSMIVKCYSNHDSCYSVRGSNKKLISRQQIVWLLLFLLSYFWLVLHSTVCVCVYFCWKHKNVSHYFGNVNACCSSMNVSRRRKKNCSVNITAVSSSNNISNVFFSPF